MSGHAIEGRLFAGVDSMGIFDKKKTSRKGDDFDSPVERIDLSSAAATPAPEEDAPEEEAPKEEAAAAPEPAPAPAAAP